MEEPVLIFLTKPLQLTPVTCLCIFLTLKLFTPVAMSSTAPPSGDLYETTSNPFSGEEWQPLQLCQSRSHHIVYMIQQGDTLGEIADRFGVSVSEIQRWNNLPDNNIRAGDEISIHGVSSQEEVRRQWLTYLVEPGDTLSQIAEEHDVSLSDLLSWNRGVQENSIQIGQEIRLRTDHQQVRSASVGTPQSGRLSRGIQLQDRPGYSVKNPARAFGTQSSVAAINEAFTDLSLHYPEVSTVSIGDLSFATGGRMTPHVSHQSGRDADIGYFMIHQSDEAADRFVVTTPENLDVAMTWYLFKRFIDQGTVQYIFMDYSLQEQLYFYLQRRGASEEELSFWLQYPDEGASRGIIRDARGHDDHFHIRFHCAEEDMRCGD